MYQCISRPSSTKCSKFCSFIPFSLHFFLLFSFFFLVVVAFHSGSVCSFSYHFLFSIPYVSLILTHIQSAILTHFRWKKRGKKTSSYFMSRIVLCVRRTWYTHIIQCVCYTRSFFSGVCVCSGCEFNVICAWNEAKSVRGKPKERMIYVIQFE